MDKSVVFPLTVRFEDGEVENYESVSDLQMNLEDFDSEQETGCEVRDALGRRVRLRLTLLDLKELSLLE